MNYTEIMVRYGELSTKGKNKRTFINRLSQNVRRALHDFPEIKILGERDHMYLELNGADSHIVMKRLEPIFGIQNYSPVVRLPRDMDVVKKVAVEMVQSVFKEGQTFKITTKRADHLFELDTNDINQLLGAEECRSFA